MFCIFQLFCILQTNLETLTVPNPPGPKPGSVQRRGAEAWLTARCIRVNMGMVWIQKLATASAHVKGPTMSYSSRSCSFIAHSSRSFFFHVHGPRHASSGHTRVRVFTSPRDPRPWDTVSTRLGARSYQALGRRLDEVVLGASQLHSARRGAELEGAVSRT